MYNNLEQLTNELKMIEKVKNENARYVRTVYAKGKGMLFAIFSDGTTLRVEKECE